MKHENVWIALYFILANSILGIFIWLATPSLVWENNGDGDFFVEILAIIGIFALFYFINFVSSRWIGEIMEDKRNAKK